MKNKILSIIIPLLVLAALVFIMLCSAAPSPQNDMARVNFVQGFYVFIEATPVTDFEVLGTERITGGSMASYQQVRDVLMKRAHKDFPAADGIIFSFPNNATVIRFK